MIISGGEGFTVDQEISLPKGAIGKVTEIDSKGAIVKLTVDISKKGEGFMPSDFAGTYQEPLKNSSGEPILGSDGKPLTVTRYGLKANISGGSKAANILFNNGVIYHKLAYDACPLESTSGPVRLTLPSYRGEKAAEGTNVSSVGLSPNKDGKYDAFYFFKNDILHTVLEPEAFIPGFHQYVKLEIGSS